VGCAPRRCAANVRLASDHLLQYLRPLSAHEAYRSGRRFSRSADRARLGCGKRLLWSHFNAKNDHFNETGSRQTGERTQKKRVAFSLGVEVDLEAVERYRVPQAVLDALRDAPSGSVPAPVNICVKTFNKTVS
jgi:hypothetical protein